MGRAAELRHTTMIAPSSDNAMAFLARLDRQA